MTGRIPRLASECPHPYISLYFDTPGRIDQSPSTMKSRHTFAFLACLGLVACGGGTAAGGGVETARAKVPDGGKLYDDKCADCHGRTGEGSFGTPAAMGSGALGKFATAKDLFEYVKKEMPLPKASAGSLSDGEYWSVVSFLVAAQGKLPAGGLNAGNAASVALH
jgi:mono/diheme cytochrome c family protein